MSSIEICSSQSTLGPISLQSRSAIHTLGSAAMLQRMIRSHAASLALHDNPSPHTNRLATCISFYICCSKACLLGAPRQPITTVSCLKLALAPKQLGACSVEKRPRTAQAISSFQSLPGPVNRRAMEAKNCAWQNSPLVPTGALSHQNVANMAAKPLSGAG